MAKMSNSRLSTLESQLSTPDLTCERCGAGAEKIVHFEAVRRGDVVPQNRCRACGHVTDYLPTQADIARAVREHKRLRLAYAVQFLDSHAKLDEFREQVIQTARDLGLTEFDAVHLLWRQELALDRGEVPEMAEVSFGRGYCHDDAPKVYCPTCGAALVRLPCIACQVSPSPVRRFANPKLNLWLSEIGLSVRTVNSLESAGVRSVGELLQMTRGQLEEIPNFGAKTVAEVYQALERIGFRREPRSPDRQLQTAS